MRGVRSRGVGVKWLLLLLEGTGVRDTTAGELDSAESDDSVGFLPGGSERLCGFSLVCCLSFS